MKQLADAEPAPGACRTVAGGSCSREVPTRNRVAAELGDYVGNEQKQVQPQAAVQAKVPVGGGAQPAEAVQGSSRESYPMPDPAGPACTHGCCLKGSLCRSHCFT
ncbi:MAG: hypothetical protein ACYTE3_27330 [Planctomycetota bacterium]